MTDVEWIKSLDNIHTLKEALELVMDHLSYFGDPYYKDLAIAIHKMVARVLMEAA